MFSTISGEEVLAIAERVAQRYAQGDYHLKEDMVEAVCLEVCERAPKVDAAHNPRAFVYGIARWECRDVMFRLARIPKHEPLEAAEQVVYTPDPDLTEPVRLDLYRFLRESGIGPVLAEKMAVDNGTRYTAEGERNGRKLRALRRHRAIKKAVAQYGQILQAEPAA